MIVLIIMFAIVFFALNYYLYCMPQERVALKLGDDASWMAFVPFARNVQRMNMLDMAMWKLFFVGGALTVFFSFIIIGLITWALSALNVVFGLIVGGVMIVAYLVLYFICTFEFYSKLADCFWFDRVPTALVMMFIPLANQIFMLFIGLSDRFYNGPAGQASNKQPSEEPKPDNAEIGIIGVAGMYAGASFPMRLADEFTIGRDSTLSNIIISASGDQVSRRHCSVRYNPVMRSYEVTDFSSNGTFYGNNRLPKGQPTNVPRGSTLVIGDKNNQFRLM